jgi:hypothetical protein
MDVAVRTAECRKVNAGHGIGVDAVERCGRQVVGLAGALQHDAPATQQIGGSFGWPSLKRLPPRWL